MMRIQNQQNSINGAAIACAASVSAGSPQSCKGIAASVPLYQLNT